MKNTDNNTRFTHKIIIVEDNPSVAEIYKVRLEVIGYDCFIEINGDEAYNLQKSIYRI